MGKAKSIIVKPISSKAASDLVRSVHYSGSTAANSQLHFGVFMDGLLQGSMQFGPPIDKSKLIGLVDGTGWNDFLELNRMAFSDMLPKNSESRAMSVAFKIIRKNYPHIKWIVSFSDAAQCGDGSIYRASGFVLTSIKENTSIIRFPDGQAYASISITNESGKEGSLKKKLCRKWGVPYFSGSKVSPFFEIGAMPIPGFQLRYIYFLDPEARKRLTVPVLPFSEIQRLGAGMYRGKPSAGSSPVEHIASSGEVGGSIPTPALHLTT
jgi:hypothetical protein